MSYTNKHIVDSYSGLFEGLSELSKIELIETLSKSLKRKKKSIETDFYNSFGAFASKKSADEIVAEIKSARKFSDKKNLKF